MTGRTYFVTRDSLLHNHSWDRFLDFYGECHIIALDTFKVTFIQLLQSYDISLKLCSSIVTSDVKRNLFLFRARQYMSPVNLLTFSIPNSAKP